MPWSEAVSRLTRRLFSPGPAAHPEGASAAWRDELVNAYPTRQYYAGPLTTGDNLTGETAQIRDGYPRLLKEATVKAALGKKVLSVAQLDLQVAPDPADPDDPQFRAAAEWVRWALTNCSGGVPRIVWNVAMPALLSGWSVSEKVWDRVDGRHRKYPGSWTLSALKSKLNVGGSPPIRYRLDEYKNVVGVRSMAAGTAAAEFPPEEFVRYAYWPLFESPWGLSDLRAAYRDADFLDASIKLRQILLENFSGPFLRGKYRQGDKAMEAQLRQVLANARARGFVTYPEGSEVDVINLATSAPDQFNATVENLSKRIFLAINGAYLDSLESSTTQGDSETARSVSDLFVWYLATDVATCLTEQLVPDLVVPNYGAAGGRPVVTFGGIDLGFLLKQAERLDKAKNLGLDVSRRQAYDLLGLEPPADDADRLGGADGGQPGPAPDPFGGGDALAFADDGPPGPPPRPGLVWKRETRRWAKPEGDEGGSDTGGSPPTARPAAAGLPTGDQVAAAPRVPVKPGFVDRVEVDGKSYAVKYSNKGNNSADTEVTVSELANIAGVRVPAVRKAAVGGKEALVMEWMSGGSLESIPEAELKDRMGKVPKADIDRVALFDYLIGSSDGHDGNYMLTDGNELVVIDREFSLGRQVSQSQKYIPGAPLKYVAPDGYEPFHKFDKASLDEAASAGRKMAAHLENQGRSKEARGMMKRVAVVERLARDPDKATSMQLSKEANAGARPPGESWLAAAVRDLMGR